MPNSNKVLRSFDDQPHVKYMGKYRGIVVDNVDEEHYGRCKIWVPDLMSEIKKENAPYFFPMNQIVGGQHDKESKWFNSSFIPEVNTWMWVEFENGNPERGFYTQPIQLKDSKLQPQFAVDGNEQVKGFYFKDGSSIIQSTKEDDQRVEFTSNKTDTEEVYKIIGNQSTILIDMRNDKEKILVEDKKGNSIMISTKNDNIFITQNKDIVIQNYEKDISIIQNNGNINLQTPKKINMSQNEGVQLYSKDGDVRIKLDNGGIYNEINGDIGIQQNNLTETYNGNVDVKGNMVKIEGNIETSIKSDLNLKLQGTTTDLKGGINLSIGAANLNLSSTLLNINTSGLSPTLVSPAGPVTAIPNPQPPMPSDQTSQDAVNLQGKQVDTIDIPIFQPKGSKGNDQDRNYPKNDNYTYENIIQNTDKFPLNINKSNGNLPQDADTPVSTK